MAGVVLNHTIVSRRLTMHYKNEGNMSLLNLKTRRFKNMKIHQKLEMHKKLGDLDDREIKKFLYFFRPSFCYKDVWAPNCSVGKSAGFLMGGPVFEPAGQRDAPGEIDFTEKKTIPGVCCEIDGVRRYVAWSTYGDFTDELGQTSMAISGIFHKKQRSQGRAIKASKHREQLWRFQMPISQRSKEALELCREL
ncbi:hypothetical protein LXL04_000489 [Taraxacum kok-saghyz]